MRKETSNWWTQAKRDLISAKNALKSKDYYMVAFLCQQTVEKSLKALILYTKREFYPLNSLIFWQECGYSRHISFFLERVNTTIHYK